MTLRTLVSRLGPCLFVMCALTAHAQPSSPPPKSAPLKTLQDDLPANAVRTASSDKVRVLLVADFETTLSSPTTARIARLNVSMGLPFQSGQVLIAFDCEEPLARLKMAKAEMVAAQETLDARVRMQGLDQASAVEVALAAAAVNKARGQIDLNEAQIGQCSIKAPWSGRIAKVHIKSFMSVTPGQPLLDLVKSGPLRLKLNVPSKMIAQVSKS
ncbi:MAG: HlyD family secretion protein, partial [Ramlibacter sp.]|nr:HlyD family secretion protein [Ramlibacter sp.]